MTKVIERFKPIQNFPNYYVSECGKVKHSKKGTITIHNRQDGYLGVNLRNKSGARIYLVHRLVAETFIWNAHDKPFVNHKDGNKANAHLTNLEWVTQSENCQHAIKHGLMNYEYNYGTRNSNSKLDEKDVRKMRDLHTEGVKQRILAEKFDVTQSLVAQIVNYKLWKHIA